MRKLFFLSILLFFLLIGNATKAAVDLDTDSDSLTDNQETLIYATDPQNPDTDGDGYLDGEEVKHGYSPRCGDRKN